MRIVAGKFRGKQLDTPKSGAIRPTADRVREAVFSIIGSRIGPNLDGVRVLDLFAGTGAMGLEALSRGAGHCIFVDSGIEARGLIRGHIEAFGVAGQVKLLKRDATDLGPIERLKPATLVFADPPYGQGLGEKALASALRGGWIAAGALVVLEERKDVAVTAPEGFAIIDRRDYADTAVTLMDVTG
ncbi:16S rRNA (guanine(966)-N(2))-methyltransferase RsmD [Pelagibacterium xiamenense]|uniref:16S rRNA (guanine(966)-N(2))-methyltransferase RsmD n=1 Tax=Pelagibacterium xiamenense TaxID=2901140 RepID=UPI001E3D8FD9|nr:16S rRNA (guanine(966)-N(2))-methyltransferase RsmD [Pelagibacterium xiamenense]MCD7059217.1 16S rRNA (guanine(966)-N(2))-methyltransferase RsmD [Pelagibacterium xiamenense]